MYRFKLQLRVILHHMIKKKWPRHYASEILALKTREERIAYMDQHVPEDFKPLVKTHVNNLYLLSKSRHRR